MNYVSGVHDINPVLIPKKITLIEGGTPPPGVISSGNNHGMNFDPEREELIWGEKVKFVKEPSPTRTSALRGLKYLKLCLCTALEYNAAIFLGVIVTDKYSALETPE